MNLGLEQAAVNTGEQIEDIRVAQYIGALAVYLFIDGATQVAVNKRDDFIFIAVQQGKWFYERRVATLEIRNANMTPQQLATETAVVFQQAFAMAQKGEAISH